MATNSPPFELAQIPAKVNQACSIESGPEDYILPVALQDIKVSERNRTENELETNILLIEPAQIPAKADQAHGIVLPTDSRGQDDGNWRKSGPEEYILPVSVASRSKVSESMSSENEKRTCSPPFEPVPMQVTSNPAYGVVGLLPDRSRRMQEVVILRGSSPEDYILPVSHDEASESKLSKNNMRTSSLDFQTAQLHTNVNPAYTIEQTQSKTGEALSPVLSQRAVCSTPHRLQNSNNKRKKSLNKLSVKIQKRQEIAIVAAALLSVLISGMSVNMSDVVTQYDSVREIGTHYRY